jgi:hypothetical protein
MVLSAFTIVKEIKVGDILTSVSILISALAFLRAWTKDREIRNKEIADRTRSAAAITLAKLERWRDLSLWFFQSTQPLFVETSEMLTNQFDVVATRDFLWKKLNEVRTEVSNRVMKEQIEIAYVELAGYHPAVYDFFTSTIGTLKENQGEAYDKFIERTQRVVMSYKSRQAGYQTAMLGNDLRTVAYESQSALRAQTDQTLKPIHEFLINIIAESDKAILTRKILPNHGKVQHEVGPERGERLS